MINNNNFKMVKEQERYLPFSWMAYEKRSESSSYLMTQFEDNLNRENGPKGFFIGSMHLKSPAAANVHACASYGPVCK